MASIRTLRAVERRVANCAARMEICGSLLIFNGIRIPSNFSKRLFHIFFLAKLGPLYSKALYYIDYLMGCLQILLTFSRSTASRENTNWLNPVWHEWSEGHLIGYGNVIQWTHYIEWISIGCHLDKVISYGYPWHVEWTSVPIGKAFWQISEPPWKSQWWFALLTNLFLKLIWFLVSLFYHTIKSLPSYIWMIRDEQTAKEKKLEKQTKHDPREIQRTAALTMITEFCFDFKRCC